MSISPNYSVGIGKATALGMPYTGLASPPVREGEIFPVIHHSIGAGQPFSRRRRHEENYQNSLAEKKSSAGLSSPFATDWEQLEASTQALVRGVIDGKVEQVRSALQKYADPHMLVEVRDPSEANVNTNRYVHLPIGVAALEYARQKYNASGDKSVMAPYQEIASLLLNSGRRPNIEVGASSDPHVLTSVLSYQAFGMSLEQDTFGQDRLETRHVAIPMPLASLITKACPAAVADRYVSPQSEGVVYGEEVPETMKGYDSLQLISPIEEAIRDRITRYRERRDSDATSPSRQAPKMK